MRLGIETLRTAMTDYIHGAGVKIVGETEAQERNQVTLDEERDRLGLPITRITFSYSDNDRRLRYGDLLTGFGEHLPGRNDDCPLYKPDHRFVLRVQGDCTGHRKARHRLSAEYDGGQSSGPVLGRCQLHNSGCDR